MNKNADYRRLIDYVSNYVSKLMKHENKDFSQMRFPVSNCTIYKISNEIYCVISTNSFIELLQNGILKSATEEFPEKFGTGNAYDVIDAIFLMTEEKMNGVYSCYKNRQKDFVEFLKNAHCYIFKQNLDMTLNINVLRIDLFRKINPNKSDCKKFDFTGGLFHSFKHFSINKVNLSVGIEKVELFHPLRIIDFAIKAFFCSSLDKLPKKKFSSIIDFDDYSNLKFIFYLENESNVFFIDTIYKINKNI